MQLPKGTYNATDDYSYGYNSMEKDDELRSEGKIINFGAREYDSESAFWSRDPLEMKYPGQSPYIFAGNNPIKNVDKDGLELRNYSELLNVSRAIKLLDKTELGRKVLTFFRESQKFHAHINDADMTGFTLNGKGIIGLTTHGNNLKYFTYNGTYNFQKSKVELDGKNWLFYQKVFGEAFDGINEIEGENGLIVLAKNNYEFHWFSPNVGVVFGDRPDLGRDELIELAESIFHELFAHLFFYMNKDENMSFKEWLDRENINYDNANDKVKIEHDYYFKENYDRILEQLNSISSEIIISIINDNELIDNGSNSSKKSDSNSSTKKSNKGAKTK